MIPYPTGPYGPGAYGLGPYSHVQNLKKAGWRFIAFRIGKILQQLLNLEMEYRSTLAMQEGYGVKRWSLLVPLLIHVCCKYFFFFWFHNDFKCQFGCKNTDTVYFLFQVFNSKLQEHKEWTCDFKILFVNWKKKVYRTYSLRTSCDRKFFLVYYIE